MVLRFALLLAAALACFAQAPAPKDRTVVIVSIDAFPFYAFENPQLPVPTLRRLMKEGVAARGMRVSNPSVTWPSHTSMVTGVWPAKHGVLYNGLLTRPNGGFKVEPWRNKTEMVRAPTVYDLAHGAGLTTAQVDWVAIYNAPTITWQFAEVPNVEGPIEREMIAAGLITTEEVGGFNKRGVTWRDRMWTAAAAHILRRHKPNLMLFHTLNLDSTQHRYGPKNLAAETAMAFADDRVREILDALRAAGTLDRTTVLVVSDHGFKTVRRQIRPNVVVRAQSLAAHVIPEGGTAMVYLTDPAQRERVKAALGGVEGVARVIDAPEFDALGMPRGKDPAPDLILAARNGYAFGGAAEGQAVVDVPESGSHGYLSDDPEMKSMFIAWGRGIRAGATLGEIRSIDIAPTVAALLGLKMENVDGRVLTEILK